MHFRKLMVILNVLKQNLIQRLCGSMLLILASLGLHAQCQPPTLVQVSASAANEISLSWFYFDSAIGWELELVPFGESPTLQPTTALITAKNYTFLDLEPAAAYTVFIRTVCDNGAISDWNPISVRTNVPQPSPCLFSLPIKNNNCNTGLESFKIEVSDVSGHLGDDIFLSSVDLIIEHTWPADLDIRLLSPSGQEVLLSQNNGTVTDNYGEVTDSSCSEFTRFSDLACTGISEGQPPYIGAFTPETPLFAVEDDSPANGIWELRMCDRSNQDIGTLKYVNLNFEPLVCEIPRNIFVKSINATEVEVVWSSYVGCELTEINLNLEGEEIRTTSVPCQQQSIIIDDLQPGTEYEIFVLSNCLSDLKSPLSCPFRFTTACTEVTEEESFDLLSLCTPGCAFDCDLASSWTNATTEDDQDWLLWNTSTATDGTGPKSGVFGGGAFLYLESSPDICSSEAKSFLTSDCVTIEANNEGCDLSFWYHMHGPAIGSLLLLAKANEAPIWDTIVTISGEQGDFWQNSVVNLSAYDGKAVTFRFVGQTSSGTQGDIAIDQIEFRGSTFTPGGYTYYQDFDQDGFGNIDFPNTICSTRPSAVFVDNALDCQDEDPNVNPDATEIPCNGIDENCSGMADDSPTENTIVYSATITDEQCSAPLSGMILLEIQEGQGPFAFQWNTGSTEQNLVGIAAGTYICTISDASMCRVITEEIIVGRISNIVSNITIANAPSCSGQNDGSLIATADLGMPPYSYVWSNGSTNDTLRNISAGQYFVIATDSQGCLGDTTFLDLSAQGSIMGDISFMLPVSCFGGSNGVLRADGITGIAPFSFAWSNEHMGQQISGLPAGHYTCTITDATGCQAEVNTFLPEPEALVSKIVSQENVDCFGERTGSIRTTLEGGTPPYSFAWTNSRNTDDIFDLPSGTYQLTITDANACTTVSELVTISEPSKLQASVDSFAFTDCILSQDGFISVQASGGIEPYNYFWANSVLDTAALDNVTAGIYSVTITDDHNCKTTVSNFEVQSNALPIIVDMAVIGENLCADDSLVSIVADITEAALPVDYNWNTGRQIATESYADTLTLLPAGTYQLTVTDADGCVGLAEQIEVAAVAPINFSIIEKVDNVCFDDEMGMISIATTGGTAPYHFLWNNGDTTSLINELPTGKYKLTITDANSCEFVTQNISIGSLPMYEIDIVSTPSDPTSPTGKIVLDVQGANPPYTYVWGDDIAGPTDNTAIDLLPGSYLVTISDQSACDTSLVITVDMATSTSDNSRTDILIFPNPATESLFVQHEVEGTVNVSLSNTNGQEVKSIISKQSMVMIELKDVPTGVYLVTVTSHDKTYSRLITKI